MKYINQILTKRIRSCRSVKISSLKLNVLEHLFKKPVTTLIFLNLISGICVLTKLKVSAQYHFHIYKTLEDCKFISSIF